MNLRLEPSKKRVIEQAAAAMGLSVADFAAMALYERAREVLHAEQVLVLSNRDRDLFVSALDNPPTPNEKLRLAARRFKAHAAGMARESLPRP
jgi:uncharacterized protein (DUF1778 family)